MKCTKCGSEFTELAKKVEGLNQTKSVYRCLACNHTFDKTSKKYSPESKILMTLYGGLSSNSPEGYTNAAQIGVTKEGTLYMKQKSYSFESGEEFRNTTTIPVFNVKNSKYGYNLEYYSFKTLNDSNGTLFSVSKIVLSDDLKELAKDNEAMRIVLKPGFLDRSQSSSVVLVPAANWLNSILEPYRIKANATKASSSSDSGCYVATAVYGSYDCPQVWTLRRYRDNTLAKTWYGRAFIRTYYAISPTLVKWFGHTSWFKKMWKGKLDKMVAELQEKGVDSTPYEDKIY